MAQDHSPHLSCVAHSGMNTKLTANLIINSIAAMILAVLLNTAMDIKANTLQNAKELARLEREIGGLKERVITLERSYFEPSRK